MTTQNELPPEQDVDVAICGGGLAGLCLARQLRMESPELSVAVVEAMPDPLPDAAHKVGESLAETGAHYLSGILGLEDMLDRTQLPKMGLRFYFPKQDGDTFADRSEFGLSGFPKFKSYQIDRGRFESDLRQQVVTDGVSLRLGCRVEDITLGEDGAPHSVEYSDKDGQKTKLNAAWVVDASGRKRILQRQLGYARRSRGKAHNAAWFRVRGRVNLDALVPEARGDWHARVDEENRWFSTNHLVDKGYWIWVIPLASDCTSIGIVAADELHPLAGYQTLARAQSWLEEQEPEFAELLKEFEVMDFLAFRDYSYSSSQVASDDRWATIGEAGVFADPLYSPGSDLIAIANCCVSGLIRRERGGEDIGDAAKITSRYIISLNEALTASIQASYEVLGSSNAMAAKLLWDFCAAWSFIAPPVFNRLCPIDPDWQTFRQANSDFFSLTLRMRKLFRDWAAHPKSNGGYQWFDYLTVPTVSALRDRNLKAGKPIEELVQDQRQNIADMETLAQVLFLAAVRQVHPEKYEMLKQEPWLNAWGIDLDPEQWETTGLLQPKTEKRDLGPLIGELEGLTPN